LAVHQHFLDLIGATNLIPGPNSTEMAIHIGHERGGWKGLLVTFLSEANIRIFLVFLKIGAILYGNGYVLFAFLDSELVAKGLLSRTQLVDAIAVGQFTPGPVFSSVTFIGWQMNGLAGAVMAASADCLPFAH
jgi:chromate transport protein ChrA